MSDKEYKVGDVVGVKYDVEQGGKIEKIEKQRFGETRYFVRLFSGEYVEDKVNGDLVPFLEEDFFN